MLRCEEEGWELIRMPDGRRGLWVRVQQADAQTVTRVELCSGREGDDDYVRLDIGQVVTSHNLYDLREAMYSFRFAYEVAEDNDRHHEADLAIARLVGGIAQVALAAAAYGMTRFSPDGRGGVRKEHEVAPGYRWEEQGESHDDPDRISS